MLAIEKYVRPFAIRTFCSRRRLQVLFSVGFRLPVLWKHNFSAGTVSAAKRVSKQRVRDLAQGKLSGEPLPPANKDDLRKDSLTQVVRKTMDKFSNCVVLTRVGNFYELYFEHASTYGPHLDLRVVKKGKDEIPMAGFQYMYLDRYLKRLVQDLNQHVAICEEYPEWIDGQLQTPILRKVKRVVTPGTLIDEEFVTQDCNNFLLSVFLESDSSNLVKEISTSVSAPSQNIGLAWIDISTGQFFVQNITRSGLSSALLRIGASEVVISDSIPLIVRQEIAVSLNLNCERLAVLPTASDLHIKSWNNRLDEPLTGDELSSFSINEMHAIQNLFEYIDEHLLDSKLKPRKPQRREQDDTMSIDRSSVRGLELLQTAKDGLGKGSLLNTIKRTVTKGGARLLRERLVYPSIIPKVIEHRLDLISAFISSPQLHAAVIVQLKSLFDISRIVQKFSLDRGDPEEMLCLANTSFRVKEILRILENNNNQDDAERRALKTLVSKVTIDGPDYMAEQIKNSIDEQGLMESLAQETRNEFQEEDDAQESGPFSTQSGTKPNVDRNGREDPWIMRTTASPELTKLHSELAALSLKREELQGGLREQLSAPKLVLKYDNRYGYVCHAPRNRGFNESALEVLSATPIGMLKTSRLFHLTEWTNLGRQTDTIKFDIRAEENRIFQRLRGLVVDNIVPLRHNASVMDELDLASSFATLANDGGWIRPNITTKIEHNIIGGRHPTVKLGLQEKGQTFVANDLNLDTSIRAWLITGPNMAGKSTFLRQNALVTILAQVGCYVPAEYAEIGIVDRIFSRIGAADDLFRNQSTFMVEMLETATILRDATERSLVIMDEVGRGTAPEDGTAVAFASLHHLYNINKCRVLFATHFHSLADMTEGWKNLAQHCTDVYEDSEGGFTFIHKLRPGVNRKSHALKVAQMAGLPAEALNVAQDVLDRIAQTQSTPFLLSASA